MKKRLFFAGLFNVIGGLLVLGSVVVFISGDKSGATYFLLSGLMSGNLADEISER